MEATLELVLKQAQEMLTLNTVAGKGHGGSVMNQHEGQDRWSNDLTFRVGDEVGGHWQQLIMVQERYSAQIGQMKPCWQRTDLERLQDTVSCDCLDEVPLSVLTVHIAKLDAFNNCL